MSGHDDEPKPPSTARVTLLGVGHTRTHGVAAPTAPPVHRSPSDPFAPEVAAPIAPTLNPAPPPPPPRQPRHVIKTAGCADLGYYEPGLTEFSTREEAEMRDALAQKIAAEVAQNGQGGPTQAGSPTLRTKAQQAALMIALILFSICAFIGLLWVILHPFLSH